MSKLSDEIKTYIGYFPKNEEDALTHYGVSKRDGAPGRGSGRYPLGSGDDPYQHSINFIQRYRNMKAIAKDEKELARLMGCSSTGSLRRQYSNALSNQRLADISQAKALRDEGLSYTEIGKRMGGINESSVRSLLNSKAEGRTKASKATAEFLKDQIHEKGMIDVGTGIERELGISGTKLDTALDILQSEGYKVYNMRVQQVTNPDRFTTVRVACPPGTEYREIYDLSKIQTVTDYTAREGKDGNDIFEKAFVYPKSMDSSRMQVRYAEDGGLERDGTVEIRRGVPDLSLGESNYAQVRILVDGTHYIKGMAVYSDDLPKGVDVMFNTNKHKGTPLEKVLKPIKDDQDNPFGALIKEKGGQSYYTDENGNRQLSLVNKTREEGDWGSWSDSLPSQFLSKQPISLIRKQLDISIGNKKQELAEIAALTNPTIKRELLNDFASSCDSTAVHLEAAALPRQKYRVILPVPSLKDNEVYAPSYQDGETVALIRYPHGGTFEIPILTVNNRQADAKKIIGSTALDAIGINSHVAERLSGADFDGDTVMVIPCNSPNSKVRITSKPPLKGLEGFDPKTEYPEREGMTYMRYTNKKGKLIDNTQKQMGEISNLITDMTLKGAGEDELARAVRHSMVVIDAGKHKLDYKASEKDNRIDELKRLYQSRYDEDGKYHEGGASTLISRAGGDKQVLKRKGQPKIDKDTGELIFKEVREEYTDPKTGQIRVRTQKSSQMAEIKDAHTLSSGTPKEDIYADYANANKALANEARKMMANTGRMKYHSSAADTYATEVAHLNAQLNTAEMNAPRERKAQMLANVIVKAKTMDNPNLTAGEKKKIGQQALSQSRIRVGAKRYPIDISDREWEAIQAGAISDTKLQKIFKYTDTDVIRKRATPRTQRGLTPSQQSRIKAMANYGYTIDEIAKQMDISTSTVSEYIK